MTTVELVSVIYDNIIEVKSLIIDTIKVLSERKDVDISIYSKTYFTMKLISSIEDL